MRPRTKYVPAATRTTKTMRYGRRRNRTPNSARTSISTSVWGRLSMNETQMLRGLRWWANYGNQIVKTGGPLLYFLLSLLNFRFRQPLLGSAKIIVFTPD